MRSPRTGWAVVTALLVPVCVVAYASTCPSFSPNCPWPTSGADPADCGECEWAGVTGYWDRYLVDRYLTRPSCDIHTIHCPGWYYHLNNRNTDYRMRRRIFYCELPPPDGNCDNNVRDDGSTTCSTVRISSSSEGDCCYEK